MCMQHRPGNPRAERPGREYEWAPRATQGTRGGDGNKRTVGAALRLEVHICTSLTQMAVRSVLEGGIMVFQEEEIPGMGLILDCQ